MNLTRLFVIALLAMAGSASDISVSGQSSHLGNNPRQVYTFTGFGQRTAPLGSDDTYHGNVGIPFGSNIIEVPVESARGYKYVVRFKGVPSETWTVVIWNKYGADGKMDGWFGRACHGFSLTGGQARYIAFDENSQGGWSAARGLSIPLDAHGGYASTWGEFDFGSHINHGWSGFDVSVIAAQNAGVNVQGMKICDGGTRVCSSVSEGAAQVDNAYSFATRHSKGIGGNLAPGPVRLDVRLGEINRAAD